MAKYELKLPKMGESVAEATVTSWLKDIGETIEADDIILEIATDKVDTEVPCEIEGVLREKLFEEGEVVQVGQTIAIVDTEMMVKEQEEATSEISKTVEASAEDIEQQIEQVVSSNQITSQVANSVGRFYSPLVRNIANEEGLTNAQLDTIKGTGIGDRVTKNDILNYISSNQKIVKSKQQKSDVEVNTPEKKGASSVKDDQKLVVKPSGEDEIIEMTRMGKMISQHMKRYLELAG